eukprot:332581-Rhodomonas_salina.3
MDVDSKHRGKHDLGCLESFSASKLQAMHGGIRFISMSGQPAFPLQGSAVKAATRPQPPCYCRGTTVTAPGVVRGIETGCEGTVLWLPGAPCHPTLQSYTKASQCQHQGQMVADKRMAVTVLSALVIHHNSARTSPRLRSSVGGRSTLIDVNLAPNLNSRCLAGASKGC